MKAKKNVIKFLLLACFVLIMLYFNIKDNVDAIWDTLQNLNLRHTVLLIILSSLVYVIGGISIALLGKKAEPSYSYGNGIANSLIALFLMNVSASAVAKTAQMLLFKIKKISWEEGCSILVMDQLLYQISYILLSGTAVLISYDRLASLFPKENLLALLGFGISFFPLLGICLLFLWPALQRLLIRLISWCIDKLHLSINQEKLTHTLEEFVQSLQLANSLYRKDKKLMFLVHLLNTLKLTIRHSLPLAVAIALRIPISVYQLPLFFSASFFIDLMLSAMPVYGKHGVAETTFTLVFTPIVGAVPAASMMLIWRVVTFYTNTIIGGIVMMFSPDISFEALRNSRNKTPL